MTNKKTISHFQILEPLGAGGMGQVYKALDTKLKRTVALKFVSGDLMEAPEARRRLLREARSAATLNHPNICTIHEVGEVQPGEDLKLETGELLPPGTPFIAMELIDGKPLDAVLSKSGPLPLDEFLDIAVQVAEGLAEAHAQGIVHRDLKPQNVVVTPKGLVKILDFGLAKPLTAGDQVTSTAETITAPLTHEGTLLGTAPYMSPEQATGKEIDSRSDVFSFGVMLYEMAVGKRPFRGENAQEILAKILEAEPTSLSEVKPDLPVELERITRRCLRKKPEERYNNTRDLVAALKDLARESVPGTTKVATPTARAPRRSRAVLTWAVPVIIVAALLIWFRPWASLPDSSDKALSPDETSLAVVDFTDLATPDDPTTAAGIAGLLHVGLVESSPCRVVSPQYLYDLRRRLFGAGRGPIEKDQALEVARESGATMLLSGQIVTPSAHPYITWQLVNTQSGASLGARRVEGENLAVLADRIIADVLPLLANECGVEESTVPPPVSTLTTAFPQAYQHYVAGVLAREKARGEDAVRELEHAVRIDSTFALAHFELARATFSYLERTRASAHAERAWALRTRLGMKDRLRLEAWRQRLDGRSADALSTSREMLARWPDDREVLGDLSSVLLWYWHFNEAIQVAEKGLALYPDDLGFGNTYGMALGVGRLEEALEWSQVYIERHPGTANAWDERGSRFLSLGLPDSAETAFRQALEIEPDYLWSLKGLAYCDYARGDVNRAITKLEQILAQRKLSPEDRFQLLTADFFWPGLSLLYAEMGRFEKALKLFEEARQYISSPDAEIAFFRERPSLLLRMGRAEEVLRFSRGIPVAARARALAALDSLEAARSALVELLALPKSSVSDIFEGRMITSEIQLAAGNPERALVTLNEIKRDGVPSGGEDIKCRELVSRAFQMTGKLDRAEREHLELLRIYGGHALSHYELGQIYEEMGRSGDAEKELTKFLEMWSEADEGLPQVEDAKKRLAALRTKAE